METQRLKKLAGAGVALASCVALFAGGLATAPAYAVDYPPFSASDNFLPGSLKSSSEVPTVSLTVTKYKQTNEGGDATGSVNDATTVGGDDRETLAGVEFKLWELTVDNGKSVTDVKITDGKAGKDAAKTDVGGTVTINEPGIDNGSLSEPTLPAGQSSVKTTNSQGVIQWTWPNDGTVHYYVLQEIDEGPNTVHQFTEPAETTLFGLPFYTVATDDAKTSGYVYSLSVFPKNISTTPFNKTVKEDGDIVQAGDTLHYTLTQKIETQGTAHTDDGKFYLSQIGGSNQPQLRLVDRLSSALEVQTPAPKAQWTCKIDDPENPGRQKTTTAEDVPGASYDGVKKSTAAQTANPDKVNGGTGKIFPAEEDSVDVQYAIFDFWSDQGVGFVRAVNDANCVSAVTITIELTAKIVSNGDDTAATPGTITNTAGGNFNNGANQDLPKTTTYNLAAGFNFVKTDSQTDKALASAVFRLSKPDDPTQFLLDDGTFANTEPAGEDGAKFVSATSTKTGVVTFAGLPLFTATQKAKPNKAEWEVDTDWVTATRTGAPATGGTATPGLLHLVEVTTPDGYKAPGTDFKVVDFSSLEGKKVSDLTSNTTIEPDYTKFDFGQFNADEAKLAANDPNTSKKFYYTATNGDLVKVEHGLINFLPEEKPGVIGLPLTGGAGVVIFLIVGATIMGVTLYVRRRHNRSNAVAA